MFLVARSVLWADRWRAAIWHNGVEVWACDHLHASETTALACAVTNARDWLHIDVATARRYVIHR